MKFKGITFNGLHTYDDLGLTLIEKSIGNPAKEKKIVRLPYGNVEYDLSEVYGGQVYSNRELTYVFNVLDESDTEVSSMNIKKIRVLNELVPAHANTSLYDDDIPGYHFLAEIREAPDFDENRFLGKLTLKFTAHSFKIKNEPEFDDDWDIFNFAEDVAQLTELEIFGVDTFDLINTSTSLVYPTITASADMTLKMGNSVFKVKKGEVKSFDFMLKKGINTITIYGVGTIKFLWYKEVL